MLHANGPQSAGRGVGGAGGVAARIPVATFQLVSPTQIPFPH